MKYEMIFGDKKLFDGAPADAEFAGWFCQEIRWYMVFSGKILFSDGDTWHTSDNPYLSADIAAMRRIIKEPKRWTWEDKKNGRLPDVGSNVLYDGESCSVIRLSNTCEICIDFVGQLFLVYIQELKPIETPDEKAARLKSEWCDKAAKQLKNLEYTSTLTSIYDAMLSGELPPVQTKDGA
jgi:hypothetical protein